MVPKGWNQVVDYYRHIDDSNRWTPWSKPVLEPPAGTRTRYEGKLGSKSFKLLSTEYESLWHDVPLRPSDRSDTTVINMVTEIPMYMTAKMEIMKDLPNNPIMQDTNGDGSERYYTYGTPFFNYGLIPQTWEDPSLRTAQGYGGDNDPIDVMEFGSEPLPMGSITPCRVIGSLELIDEGETDHKILCIALSDRDANNIRTLDDLERFKPGTMERLKDWLKRYKTSDGKPENALASEIPRTTKEALDVIQETHEHWRALCGKNGASFTSTRKTAGFWLNSPGCRGE
jgi:3'-phosphoadenosine 5'-phosphosulfate synthase